MTQGGGPEQEGDFWLREGRRSGLEPAFFVDDILHPKSSPYEMFFLWISIFPLMFFKEPVHLQKSSSLSLEQWMNWSCHLQWNVEWPNSHRGRFVVGAGQQR
ncbi:hypothetical protein CEXT_9741 [Caerostris extrusa]|uniref:Uncharacterized protein n=1 Tax=Caerostris extrusa TaxID=172846 RepID=A0AAV4TGY9_CAEEX|nr:hypothetical protein CEXT_9741 [Caerostris extrusa]